MAAADQVLVSSSKTARKRVPSSDVAWVLIGRFGFLAVFVGLFDIALAWYPLMSGNPAWEFGVFNLTVWSLPFPTTGLVAMLASAVALDRVGRVRIVAICMLGLAVAIVTIGLLYALVVPIALQGAPPEAQLNVRKSMLKTAGLVIAFSTTYIVLAVTSLRSVRGGARI